MSYLYTAGTLLSLLVQTTWLVVTLTIVAALARRWLLVTRRRLAYEAAMQRRKVAQDAAARKSSEGESTDAASAAEVEEPQVDLVALSDTSLKLINTAVVVAGLIGLSMVWSEVLAALRILDDFILWHHTVTVGGQDQVEPVTLADIGLALILRAYLGSIEYRLSTTTDLHRAINRKLDEAGIAIAFPQRDLHLDAAEALRVRIENPREANSHQTPPAGTQPAEKRG